MCESGLLLRSRKLFISLKIHSFILGSVWGKEIVLTNENLFHTAAECSKRLLTLA